MPALARARASSAPQKRRFDHPVRSPFLFYIYRGETPGPPPSLRSKSPPELAASPLPPSLCSCGGTTSGTSQSPSPLIAAFTGKRHFTHSTCKRGTKNAPFGPKPFRVYKILPLHKPPNVNAACHLAPLPCPEIHSMYNDHARFCESLASKAKIIFLFAKFIWHFEKFTYLCTRTTKRTICKRKVSSCRMPATRSAGGSCFWFHLW